MSIQSLGGGGGGGEVKIIQDGVSRSCTFKIGEAAIHFICKVPCAEVLPVFAPHNFCAKFCPRILSVKSAMVDHGVDPFVAAAIVGSVGSLSAE